MAVSRPAIVAFNRGIMSPKALARVDLKRTELSAEVQINWMPRTLGSMMLRPGLNLIGTTVNGAAIYLPFIFAADDTALLEQTNQQMRVYVLGTDLVVRVAVTAVVANSSFASNITSWTDASETGAACAWSASFSGSAKLTGTGHNRAILRQTVTVGAGEGSRLHAFRIVIERGQVNFRLGSAVGLDDIINETTLGHGEHSLAFTPGGDFSIQFSSDTDYAVYIGQCAIEAAGDMIIPTPWSEGDLPLVRWGESADVVFVACSGIQQRKIERRGVHSWSIVYYEPQDGPFMVENVANITIAASAIKGDITLTASRDLWYSTHVGALWRIRSVGQLVTDTVAGADQWSDPIEVSGIGQARNITANTTGVWVGTIRLQRSVGAIGVWEDVAGESTAANWTNHIFNDTFDNDLIFYRIGFKSGEYTSGSAVVSLQLSGGGINGIVRITGFTNSKSVTALVLKTLGGTAASDTWWEGLWSDFRGWPTAVDEPYEGRLPWAGKDKSVQSVSDAYASFDDTIEGDSGPIIRSIGSGPVDTINWVLGLQRLLLGGDCREYSIRSSSLDEPLTPSNWNLKPAATQGSAKVPACRMDSDAIYVHRSGSRIFRLTFAPSYTSLLDYSAADLTKIAPELGDAGFVRVAIQRMPDTRIHCLRADGTAAILVFDVLEEVSAWVEFETLGLGGCVEDVVVLPGEEEDEVYYAVRRTNGEGTEFHTLERWAMESECQGGIVNKQADCHAIFHSDTPTTAITGLPEPLWGADVVIWGDGKDLGGINRTVFTVDGAGNVTAPVAIRDAVIGLGYYGFYKSTKLAYGGQGGETALGAQKEVKDLAIICGTLHAQGLEFGPSFDHLDSLPWLEEGVAQSFDRVWASFDHDPIEFPGQLDTDSRICLVARAPRPAEVLGLVPGIHTADVT